MTPQAALATLCAMLRAAPRLLLLAPLCAAGLACDGGDGDDASGSATAGESTLLDEVDGYRGWARAPGDYEVPLVPSQGVHGGFVDIYVNDVVADALLSEEDTLSAWPTGSIIVKDGFSDAEGTSLSLIAIMEKRAGGWYWEEYTADDLETPIFSGAPDICVDCHSAGSDSVRAFSLP